MDKTAEYGLAAHWKYKQSSNKINTDWITKLDNEKDIEIGDYCELVKGDLFTEEITIYSPNYEIFTLPRGSVALDFAYQIHSDLGNRARHAYVNKKKVSLLTELKSGDTVKIITDKKNIPRCTWIDSVKTHHAKKEMKSLCNYRTRDIDIQTGYNILRTILQIPRRRIEQRLEKLGLEDVAQKIVDNEPLLKSVVQQYTNELKDNSRFIPLLKSNRYKLKTYKFKSMKVLSNQPISDLRFDYCCHPHNGDDILGVLDGTKVAVHHKMCSQVAQTLDDHLNMVFIEWDQEMSYKYKLIISLSNHRGALAEFLQHLVKLNIDVLSIKTEKDSVASGYTLYFELEIESKEKSIDKIERELEHKTKIIQLTSASDSYKR
jgi:GTP pyrophosphokinase